MSRVVGWSRALGLALGACLMLACGEPAVPGRGLLLITLDTTRADRIGAYGYRDGHTPTLDRLASEGVLFETAIAPTPITLPSHASMLTGVYPQAHGVRDNAWFALRPEAELISETLRERGWRTGAFVGASILDARFGLDQGFEIYRNPIASLSKASIMNEMGIASSLQRPANEVVSEALGWLSTVRPDESYFLWIHLYDPHDPFTPPEPWRSSMADLYDAEIAFVDAEIGKLLRGIEQLGLAGSLTAIVTSDHGESLGEHGEKTHGVFVYQATQRVPLILWGAGIPGRGMRIDPPVSIAAVVPTLLQLAGVTPDALPAVKLAPLPLSPDAPERAVEDSIYVESFLPYYSFRWRATRGLLWGHHKLIDGVEPELYALDSDPSEQNDLAAEQAEQVAQMQARLAAMLDRHAPLGWARGREVGDHERARLEALGYVAGSAGSNPFAPDLPDARQEVANLDEIAKAAQLLRSWRRLQVTGAAQARDTDRQLRALQSLKTAKPLLERLQREHPNNVNVPVQLGGVELALENFQAASVLLERAAAHHPGSAAVHHDLALAYAGAGSKERSVRAMQTAVALAPDDPRHSVWLVDHYVQAEEFGRAVWWLRERLKQLAQGTPEHDAVMLQRERVMQSMIERNQREQPPAQLDPVPTEAGP